MESVRLGQIDYVILLVYTAFVLGIGFALKRFMRTSTDFFLSGRSIPAWITGLAFISANIGAQEVIGMAASGAKYGMMTCHFYWLGAIPAMVFVGIFMMPYYYGSKARSVPEYLKLRFDEKTRGLNAITFAAMTVLSSGISMYALARLLALLLGWDFHFSLFVSAVIVLGYVLFGGLTSAIYNEVLQFFLIVFGFLPLSLLGLYEVGGWSGLVEKLNAVAQHQGFQPGTWTQTWAHMGKATDNPMNVEWFGMVMGLGFVLSFGYWCTDFLVVQRAMAANSMSAARRTPLIASFPKILMPILVILPGMLALVAVPHKDIFTNPETAAAAKAAGIELAEPRWGLIPPEAEDAKLTVGGVERTVQKVKINEGKSEPEADYNMAVPMMLIQYFPTGLLALGLTALMASFMSGMAGNVTAFNTVWTYDIYQSYIMPGRSDTHYLWMGRAATVFGILASIAAAYAASRFNSIMDMLQLVFAFVNAPLFATFMLGMFWKRATGHGAFFGLLAGTLAAAAHHGLTIPDGATTWLKGGWFGAHHVYRSEMAQGFWTAIFAWTTCFVVTIVVSLLTRRNKTDDELRGLVYSLTPHVAKDESLRWYAQPGILAVAVLLITVVLNVIFW